MNETPKVGELVTGEVFRDAIHVAVAPVEAGGLLSPGQHVRLIEGVAYFTLSNDERAIGVVDPFLKVKVEKGERFYLFLYPNTVTSLRHAWAHPAFKVKINRITTPVSEA
jgi:hypothetical protein